ncbi:putative house-cleaning noncanonical NTP pyrophosphatase (MazG superfamily) [Chryseobacterium sediminis]|uniref:House-cleaning noncanonical NTP pyrophosphatase (MazG superfamily) n=1 Tax=Chryseobacterium sediminis TaxID=1679494 RepID=A0ABR6PWM5_9FLAO|nr:helix-turn-helix domain-containing protein [Chryseobacterium sediminis]MBB6330096.1 putative house-cleaning noncanonical NTP pyrophosphatase (MazG superfamily) [Chryseobacterium sediminis]
MILDLKNIHIGSLIKQRIEEININVLRICKFLKCTEDELNSMLSEKSLDSEIILKLSTLLEYDFFRLYSQYLILYAPQTISIDPEKKTSLPQYRKNIYTKEMVDFILEQIENGSKTQMQIVKEYRIPRSTLYKWVNKYAQSKKKD